MIQTFYTSSSWGSIQRLRSPAIYWHKDRNIDQWNKIEIPEINPLTYGHLIFDKESRIYNGEKTISLANGCWQNSSTTFKRMKLEHFLTPYTKINWKWIRAKCKTRNYKTPRGKHRQNTLWHKSQQDPLWSISQSNGNKSKNK